MRGKVRRTVNLLVAKFRKPTMKKDLLHGNLESIAKALTGRRLPYVYLVWKNPRFRDKPELQIPRSGIYLK